MISADTHYSLQYQAQARSPVAAYLMLIALGVFGVHRFYLGRSGTGAALLVLSLTGVGLLVSVVWAFVDAFLVHRYVTEFNTDLVRRITETSQQPTAA